MERPKPKTLVVKTPSTSQASPPTPPPLPPPHPARPCCGQNERRISHIIVTSEWTNPHTKCSCDVSLYPLKLLSLSHLNAETIYTTKVSNNKCQMGKEGSKCFGKQQSQQGLSYDEGTPRPLSLLHYPSHTARKDFIPYSQSSVSS